MSAANKKAQQLARQLFKLSFVDGRLSSERVAGVLEYIEKTADAHPLAVLKAYHRLVAIEVARNQAVVEHAGEVSTQTLQSIAAALSKKYNRSISAVARPNPGLLAGLRVRVGDDVYESSVAGQLGQLSQAV
ncbi:MAG TPA: F0F1 ATP synthase subunit delta [Opitutaceae bacterium]|nr:F0F1 ATP synthase subunit delta [Opitutaceae bacterium]